MNFGSKLLSLGILISITTFSQILPESYNFQLLYNHSKIEGFVQIPKGGQLGTTDINRPTFDEMGIKKMNFPEIQAQANWKKFSVYGDIKYIKFKGNSTLTTNLISHSKKIPKDSDFKTFHKYINYTLGLKYNLYSIESFRLQPLIEYSICDFSYKYNATTPLKKNISSNRSFGWCQTNIGLTFINQLTSIYSIETTFKYGLHYNKIKQFYSLMILNRFNLYKGSKNNDLNLLIGVSYGRIKFKDNQKDQQNHITQKIKPNIFVGIEYLI